MNNNEMFKSIWSLEEKHFSHNPIVAKRSGRISTDINSSWGRFKSRLSEWCEGKVLWDFLPTVHIIQEPSFPKSGAASWLCKLPLLEGIFHNRVVSKDLHMYLYNYLWVNLENPKPTNFYSICFRYSTVLWVFVPKWHDALLVIQRLCAKICNQTGIQITH